MFAGTLHLAEMDEQRTEETSYAPQEVTFPIKPCKSALFNNLLSSSWHRNEELAVHRVPEGHPVEAEEPVLLKPDHPDHPQGMLGSESLRHL